MHNIIVNTILLMLINLEIFKIKTKYF